MTPTKGKQQRRRPDGRFTGERPESLLVKAISFGEPGLAIPAQSEQSEPNRNDVDPREFIRPPFDPATWAAAMERSTRLSRCIRIQARYVAGMGWAIVPGEPGQPARAVPARASDAERRKFDKEEEELRRFFARPNRKYTILEVILYQIWMDMGATGNGYLEVTRNNKGDIDGLHHAPAVTMRVRTGGRGFIQLRPDGKRYFKDFGDETVFSSKTGKEHGGGSALPLQERATEIIHFKEYSPRSTFYGVPVHVSAAAAIAGSWFAAVQNVAFFENNSTPRLVITVSGGKLGAQSMDLIEAFLRKDGKGAKNAHRCLLLQADPKKLAVTENKVEIKVIPLTVGSQDDMSFSRYTKANDTEIREAFGITEPYFGTDTAVRSSAETGRRITEDGVFEPQRVELETVINLTVVQAIGATVAQFELVRPQSLDALEAINGAERLARAWAMTVDEMRASQGKPPMEDKEIGSKPYPLLSIEATAAATRRTQAAQSLAPGQRDDTAPGAGQQDDDGGKFGKPATTPATDQPADQPKGTRAPRALAPSPGSRTRKDADAETGAGDQVSEIMDSAALGERLGELLRAEGVNASVQVCDPADLELATKEVVAASDGGRPRVYVVGQGRRDSGAEQRVADHLADPVINRMVEEAAAFRAGVNGEGSHE